MKTFDQTTRRTNPWMHGIVIGFFAGLIWGTLRFVQYYFNFTEVHPAFLLQGFVPKAYFHTWYVGLAGWLAFIGFSILAALVYTVFLRKLSGPWWGIGYGIVWWIAMYGLIGPPLGMMKRFGLLDWNSVFTDLSLYTVWGLFIGYSIAFEFNDERIQDVNGKVPNPT